MVAAWLAHFGEALYGVKKAVELGLSRSDVTLWFLAVFLCGFPMLRHLRKMKVGLN